jgi:arylsulfatase A-like enzyme
MSLSSTLTRSLLVLALVGCAACGRERPRPGTPPRCVLLVSIEDLRADHVTGYGYIRQTTHVRKESAELVLDLDRMAQTGVAFSSAFSPAPSVAPSLASLLTGARPPEHGVFEAGERLSPDVSTLAEDFQGAGFATAAFVGTREPRLEQGLGRGFDVAQEFASDAEALKAALGWLRDSAPRQGKLLLWVHLGELGQLAQSPRLADMYSAEEGPLVLDAEQLAEEPSDGVLRRRLLDYYDGGVERANLYLHAFLENYRFAFLEDELFEDSVIVVCGTNGVELAEREGRVGSGAELLEETLRVPLVFRHPASLTGRRIFDEPVTLADVAPTLRDWLEVSAGAPGSGRNLLALTDSYIERPFERRPAQAWLQAEGELRAHSARDARWRARADSEGTQLYDLLRDPFAERDVAAEHPDLIGPEGALQVSLGGAR